MSERAWYPLKLTIHVRTYNFGDRLIPDMLGKTGVPDGIVAETWEVSDHEGTIATITNGAFAGRTLREAMGFHPELVAEGYTGTKFPMLAKFLDASHMLPVHLHADDGTAARLYGMPNGKTEAWHILWAGPNATILAGIKPGKTREQLVAAFKAQRYDDVMPKYPIKAGDTVYVPGCILHSFGPDTLIYEIQQTNDLGQDVMPADNYGVVATEEEWDRKIEATLNELKQDYLPRPCPGLERRDRGNPANRYVVGAAGPYFALERWTLNTPHRHLHNPAYGLILSNIGDVVDIHYPGGIETLGRAESCIIPAPIGDCTFVPQGPSELIVSYLPNLERDIIAPLRADGHSDDAIRSLGEVFPR